jgi:transposase
LQGTSEAAGEQLDRSTGFSVLPRRRVVERTFAWLNRNRWLAKDFEATVGSSEGWIGWVLIRTLLSFR